MASDIYTSRSILKYVFIIFSIVIATASIFIIQVLVERLAAEERARMELWADATRELIRTDNPESDLSFVQKVIESNHTIPVVLTDDEGNVLFSRNIDDDEMQNKTTIADFGFKHEPILVDFDDETKQYIYYDDSKLLRQLSYYPVVQIGVIVLFLLLMSLAFYTLQRAEQNKVWVGLSRETAHQLGTPISSLLAWNELLAMRYPDDELLGEMQKDIKRLEAIADRFSKIGSKPELQKIMLDKVLQSAINYMSLRVSNKVTFRYTPVQNVQVKINPDLFGWVIENLCKNAIDAMDGIGEIRFDVTEKPRQVLLDVSDTGKGIAKSKQKTVFLPGYTTKERGWGLGLSLAKRIIKEYHKGKIFVKYSEVGVGTTFRIVLRK
ncbi:MAG: HAMP domain-containing histidine kinase [Paludibacteraceae bacterium]|nr:HAMP domain-containing histidine kinase [Paludibacteraceae bacterium]